MRCGTWADTCGPPNDRRCIIRRHYRARSLGVYEVAVIRSPCRSADVGGCGLPSRPQREVAPDPARLERATTLTDCGLGAPLPGGCALGGFAANYTHRCGAPSGSSGASLLVPTPQRWVQGGSSELTQYITLRCVAQP